uniref:F-box/LRR-repeat protein 15-like leucin rich repeat domain-containing protein n=1 Tax=Ciona savignyi TaxID=51511 RepID=H2ZNC7_CIOSA
MDMLSVLPIQDVVFPKILIYLSTPELFLLREVSKTYQIAIQEYFKTCRTINLSELSSKVTAEAFRLMSNENRVLQELNLSNAKHWLCDELFISTVCQCPCLTVLDISNCSRLSNHSMSVLGSCSGLLNKLSISGCNWIDQDTFKVLVSSNPHLIELDVSGCWSLDDECVITLSTACRKLTHLALTNVYPITDRSVESLAVKCQGLVSLNISGCWRITNAAVRKIGEYCKNLRLLQVKDCRDVSEISLARLRRSGVKIDKSMPSQANIFRLQLQPYVNLQV